MNLAFLDVVMIVLVASGGAVVVRGLIGPTSLDRALALDTFGVIAAAFTVTYAIRSDESALVDVALALALIGFLATVALARWIGAEERR